MDVLHGCITATELVFNLQLKRSNDGQVCWVRIGVVQIGGIARARNTITKAVIEKRQLLTSANRVITGRYCCRRRIHNVNGDECSVTPALVTVNHHDRVGTDARVFNVVAWSVWWQQPAPDQLW